jgi:hypothetical protein
MHEISQSERKSSFFDVPETAGLEFVVNTDTKAAAIRNLRIFSPPHRRRSRHVWIQAQLDVKPVVHKAAPEKALTVQPSYR